MRLFQQLFSLTAVILTAFERHFYTYLRIAIFVVMVWIGGLKVCQYEADGIVPFVSNSPFMSFFYNSSSKTTVNAKGKTVKEYKVHMNKEGEVKPENIVWHQQNGTYLFSLGLGLSIVTIGTLVLLGIWCPKVGMLGGLLTFGMSVVTLSFLITTPECWVPDLSDGKTFVHDGLPWFTSAHGFPLLSGAGRLVIKDIIMSAGGLLVAAQSARRFLTTRAANASSCSSLS